MIEQWISNNLALELVYRFIACVVCGGLIGLERQSKGKPAGVRDCVLVCLGASTYIQLSQLVDGPADGSRVLGQVVTGIGFLGAGVILTKGGLVKGITSATVFWVVAALGSAIGFGYYTMAFTLSVTVLSVLYGTDIMEKSIRSLRRGVHRLVPSDSTNSREDTDD